MANEQNDPGFDAFETWLRSCPEEDAPVGLLDRCLATIDGADSPTTIAQSFRQQNRSKKLIISAAAAAIAATVFVALFSMQQEQSVFADPIQNSMHANGIHILETFSDPERSPGELRSSEWWIRPGVGMRRVGKVNGELVFIFVTYDGQTTRWLPAENLVEIKSADLPVGNFPYFTNAILALRKFEQMAKEQGVPLTQSKLKTSQGTIRRVEIMDLRGSGGPNSALMISLVVDIEDSTNRIVRKWSHEWGVGKDRDQFATGNATSVMEIDYPAVDSFTSSLFHIDYPEDARIEREGELTQGQ